MVFFSFLSWFRPWWKSTETDYESVLNRLTKDIGDVQNRLITINQRERRASVTLTLYAILIWLTYVLFVWFSTSSERMLMSKAQRAKLWLPAIAGLLIILSVRSLVRWWYLRVSAGEERHLRSLQRARRKKIDEIKQATRFDHLRTLLERYDDTAQGKPTLKRGPSSFATSTTKAGAQLQPPTTSTPTSSRGRRQTFTASEAGLGPRQFEGMRDGVRVRDNAQPQTISNSLLMQGTSTKTDGQPGQATSGHSTKSVPKIITSNQSGELLPFDSPQRQIRFQKTWLDRLADKILGVEPSNQDVAAEQRYALICHVCLTHNGLCPKEDWEEVQYICPRCGTFNSRRPSSVPVTSPWSPPNSSLRRASAEASVSPARSMHELAPPPASMVRSPSSQSLIVESISAPSLMSSARSVNGDGDDSRAADFVDDLPPPRAESSANGLAQADRRPADEEEAKEELLDDDEQNGEPREPAVRRMGQRSMSNSNTTATQARDETSIRKRAFVQSEDVNDTDEGSGDKSVEPMQVD